MGPLRKKIMVSGIEPLSRETTMLTKKDQDEPLNKWRRNKDAANFGLSPRLPGMQNSHLELENFENKYSIVTIVY